MARLLTVEIQIQFSFRSKNKTRNIFACYNRNIWADVAVVVAVVVAVMPTFHSCYRCDTVLCLDWTNELATFGSTNCSTNVSTFRCQLMTHFDVGRDLFLSLSVSSKFPSISVHLKLKIRILLDEARKKLNELKKCQN